MKRIIFLSKLNNEFRKPKQKRNDRMEWLKKRIKDKDNLWIEFERILSRLSVLFFTCIERVSILVIVSHCHNVVGDSTITAFTIAGGLEQYCRIAPYFFCCCCILHESHILIVRSSPVQPFLQDVFIFFSLFLVFPFNCERLLLKVLLFAKFLDKNVYFYEKTLELCIFTAIIEKTVIFARRPST